MKLGCTATHQALLGALLVLLKWLFEEDKNITPFVRVHQYIHYVGEHCHVILSKYDVFLGF